jgi:hypothetical protein
MSWPHGFSRRASEEVTVDASEQAGDVRSRILSSASMQSAVNRARSIDSDRGADIKRSASQELDKPEGDASAGVEVEGPPGDSQALEANPAFEAMTMTWEHLCNLAENVAVHPLLQIQAEAEMDWRAPLGNVENDHGSRDGRWAFLCERDWETLRSLGSQFPRGEVHDAMSVQAGRKEYS